MKRSHAALAAAGFLALGLAFALPPACSEGGSPFGSSAARFSFVVAGDTRGDLEGLELVDTDKFPGLVSAVVALDPRPAFFLFTGDAGLLGTQIEWGQWMGIVEPLLAAGITIYPTLGNHEVFLDLNNEGAIEAYRERFDNPQNGPADYEGLTFSFDHENLHVVCLTSNKEFHGRIDDDQIAWLEDDLARAGGRFKVVFFHEPCYPTGAHLGTSLDRDPAQRDKLWETMDGAGVDIVFAGHEHNYSRWTIDDGVNPAWGGEIVQVIAGGAGAPVYEALLVEGPEAFSPAFHYVLVEVGDEGMEVSAIDDAGGVIDRFRVS